MPSPPPQEAHAAEQPAHDTAQPPQRIEEVMEGLKQVTPGGADKLLAETYREREAKLKADYPKTVTFSRFEVVPGDGVSHLGVRINTGESEVMVELRSDREIPAETAGGPASTATSSEGATSPAAGTTSLASPAAGTVPLASPAAGTVPLASPAAGTVPLDAGEGGAPAEPKKIKVTNPELLVELVRDITHGRDVNLHVDWHFEFDEERTQVQQARVQRLSHARERCRQGEKCDKPEADWVEERVVLYDYDGKLKPQKIREFRRAGPKFTR
ncbi:MAG: hypothetical protein GF416_02460 [Candidatus Altiarchaeales archaeon]|nr:hypothetical protein [Candidatus Altiarchaeales archaeon]MBD3415982.1 hypothetical protein [Candidatus Altiarchaeales archaeon]